MSFAPSQKQESSRLMLIGPHRVFYYGLLGRPRIRNFGCATLYVAEQEPLQINLGKGWKSAYVAWVPPYTPHQIRTADRHFAAVMLEPEYTDTEAVGTRIQESSEQGLDALRTRILACVRRLQYMSPCRRITDLEFDELLFGAPLPERRIDPRVSNVVDRICENTAESSSAAELATAEGLSMSRFLHLFKEETGVSLRKYRAWRRARTLLYHVHSPATLTDIALETGYPDSTHFSHSIRRIYGLPPRDIVNGSRQLRIRIQVSGSGRHAEDSIASVRKLTPNAPDMVRRSAYA